MKKKKAAPRAVELLKELKGNNLKEIDNEIEKLATYAADRPLITAEDVLRLVGSDIISGVSDVLDAIGRNDKERALALSLDFQKKDLGAMAGLFCWNLRQLLRVRDCLKQGWPAQKIMDSLELRKFQID